MSSQEKYDDVHSDQNAVCKFTVFPVKREWRDMPPELLKSHTKSGLCTQAVDGDCNIDGIHIGQTVDQIPGIGLDVTRTDQEKL